MAIVIGRNDVIDLSNTGPKRSNLFGPGHPTFGPFGAATRRRSTDSGQV